MNAPPIPRRPESMASLKARYPLALEYVYDAFQIAEHNAIRPAEVAANVFDFEDGLRLIISRESYPGDNRVFLHFSASFQTETPIHERCKSVAAEHGSAAMLTDFMIAAADRFAELSGDTRQPTTIFVTRGGIPHWLIEE